MDEKVWIILVFVINKDGWVIFILHKPATPQVMDTFLISGRPNDSDGMQVNSLLDHIHRRGGDAVCYI